MNQYIFENKLNSNIQITIKAYSLFRANEILSTVIEETWGYKLIDTIKL